MTIAELIKQLEQAAVEIGADAVVSLPADRFNTSTCEIAEVSVEEIASIPWAYIRRLPNEGGG